MKIRNFDIQRDGPPFIIAEIGVNHDGSPKVASELVDAAARARCDAVKFQLFRADLLLSREAGLVEYQKSAAGSASELLSKLELPEAAMADLVAQTHAHGLAAIITPFSVPLVAVAAKMGIDAIKLASPDLVNRPLIEEAARAELPLILSTGQATIEEISQALEWWDRSAPRLESWQFPVVLHCVSSYPTAPEHAALGGITAMRSIFRDPAVGYSDHTVETVTAAFAVCAGACILEKHLTLSKRRHGPDHAASLEPHEMAEYVAQARQAFVMRGNASSKHPSPIELEIREQSRQSVCATRDLPAGTQLTSDMLTIKRPGTGIPAADFPAVIGQTLEQPVAANSILVWEDIQGGCPRLSSKAYEKVANRLMRTVRNLQMGAITEAELLCASLDDYDEDYHDGLAPCWEAAIPTLPSEICKIIRKALEDDLWRGVSQINVTPERYENAKYRASVARPALLKMLADHIEGRT